MLSVRV